MSDPIDDSARRAWQGTGPEDGRTRPVNIERHLLEQRNRKRRFLASAAIIVPSHIAAFWLLPDLRSLAVGGLMVGACLGWLVWRRGRLPQRDAAMPCATYQVNVLESEREFHRAMPKYLIPVVVGQIAIVLTLLTNPRFNKNAVSAEALTAGRFAELGTSFAMLLTLFIVAVIGILLFIAGRSRRMLREVEQELAILGKAVEA
jgi:membrane protease YdiL (CAAX protease family)